MFNYRFVEEEQGKVLVIHLEGEFDTSAAQTVQDKLESYETEEIDKVVFELPEATLMASSGLRVIFFARDKIKENMTVELRGAQGLVAKVIKMSGIGKFVEVN